MRMTMKQGALALTLLSGRIIGPGGPERHYYLRHHVFRPNDETRPFYSYGYGYGYGPAWSYDYYGPAVGIYGPVIGRY